MPLDTLVYTSLYREIERSKRSQCVPASSISVLLGYTMIDLIQSIFYLFKTPSQLLVVFN